MRLQSPTPALLIALAIAIGGACNRAETLTPEQAKERGDLLLRQMSKTLASTQAFSYAGESIRERVQTNGTKVEDKFTRQVTVRRPDAMKVVTTGGEHDDTAWYDGKSLTFVSNKHKAWARGPMPPTLDEAMDFVSAEYAVQIPTADLHYSSPYDALMTKETTGGWVGVESVGDTPCDHLAYKEAAVDWEIWLSKDNGLPRQFQVTYKTAPGAPKTRVVFSNFNPSPEISADTFAATIPEGYQRLRIMRHATVEDKTAAADQAPGATPAAAPAPPR